METQNDDLRIERDDRTWGFLVHLGGIIGNAVFSPVGNIIGALVIWLFKKNESRFVDIEGKEAVNFQITMSLLMVALSIINGLISGAWTFTRFLLSDPVRYSHHWDTEFFFTFGFSKAIWAVNLAFSIIAAIQANKGNHYRYPFSLRLVK
ncbi:DUF4870 domain-containing protein [Chitinophaga sp. GCM10012297]|uniref:DUF4870 domain-containing protein n=1 Tax=Chitinophaga chungangae TaxID=2821488 RepID=A0ABS3YHM8_9BACT|nr:DUF4870 domain-containing protein [Chitinophaga chungangae]MBO9154199.1 DUF4870 domain-containing protein [Chitinophaga chungangae]